MRRNAFRLAIADGLSAAACDECHLQMFSFPRKSIGSMFHVFSSNNLLLIRQAIQQMNAQNHHKQSDRYDDEQCKCEPTQDHRAGANATSYTAVSKVLSDLRGCNRCCMLP